MRADAGGGLRSALLVPLLVVAVAAMLGFNVVAVKIAIRDAGPMTVQALATMLAIVVLFASPETLRTRRWPTPRERMAAVAVGLSMTVLASVGLTFGLQRAEAGLAALIMSSTPIITLALSWVIVNERYSAHGYLGIACGVVGVAVVMLGAGTSGSSVSGVLLVLMGAACWSSGLVAMRTLGAGIDPRRLTAWQMFFGVLFLIVIAVVVEGMAVNPSWSFWAAIGYMAVFPKALATVAQMHVIRLGGTVHASSAAFLMPVFGALAGVVMLGETLERYEVLGAAAILLGVGLVIRARAEGPPSLEIATG